MGIQFSCWFFFLFIYSKGSPLQYRDFIVKFQVFFSIFFLKEYYTLMKDSALGNFLFGKLKKTKEKHIFFIQLKICWNKIKIRKFTYSIKVFIRVFYMFYFLLNLKCKIKKITFFSILFFYRFYTYFGYIGSRIKTTLLVNRMCTRPSCCSNAFVRSGKITFLFNVSNFKNICKREIYYTWVNSKVLSKKFFFLFQMEYYMVLYVL